MNGQELYNFVTQLLGGIEMDQDLFCTLVNMAKTRREGSREWSWLKKKSLAMSWSTGDTMSTSHATPSDFLKPVKTTDKTKAIVFLDSGSRKQGSADEIPMERQYDYAGTPGYFFIDYGDSARPVYFTGTPSQTLTAALFYIAKTTDIEVDDIEDTDAWTWEKFPARFHPLLGYDVAVMHKGDVDFDDINARMAQFSGKTISNMELALLIEDDRIKLSTLGV